jgi:NAD(P)-dependent dehydrogenase (short-subunit alcohol dehydrogenase family)
VRADVAPAASMHLDGIEGRVAVVTGASNGIGRCVAETLAALEARVAGIDLERGEARVPLLLAADVRDPAAVGRCFDEIERELGPVDFLVTAAGVFRPVLLGELGLDAWTRTLDINLTGTFLCVRRAAVRMTALGRGRIVTISSGAGLDGGSEACSDYAASKGGVIAFTKAVSKELASPGITVNCVAPRAVATRMIADLEAEELTSHIPVGRIGSVEDVAAGVAFLCSAHAGYITGEVLVMNGGWW